MASSINYIINITIYYYDVFNSNFLFPQLKVYAEVQGNITSWERKNAGYVIKKSVFAPDWYSNEYKVYRINFILPFINFLATVGLSLLFSIAVYNYMWKELPSSPKEKNFLVTQTGLWCGVAILLTTNILFLYFEVRALSVWCEGPKNIHCLEEPAAAAKMLLLIFIAIGSIILLVVFSVYSIKKALPQHLLSPGIQPFLIGIPVLGNVAVLFIIVLYVLVKPCKKKYNCLKFGINEMVTHLFLCVQTMLHILNKCWKFITFFLAIINIFVFLTIATFSIAPVLIQLFIHPYSIVLVYSYYLSSHVFLFTVAFIVTFLWKKKGQYAPKLQLCSLLMLPNIALMCLAIMTVPFTALYQIIISGSLSNNETVLVVASLLPSFIITSPLLLLKNRLIAIFTDPEDEEQKVEEDDDAVDEGRESRERGGRGESELDKKREGRMQTLKVV